MKTVKSRIILLFVIFYSIVSNSYSQNCDNDFYGDYDYRSQSKFAELSPGDTSRLNIVVYSNQDFRIFICYDEELGPCKYRIVRRDRKSERIVKSIEEEIIIEYKTDEYGNELFDDDYNPIEVGRETVFDTIWETRKYFEEKVLFDSENNATDKPFWEKRIKKTHRLIIEVIIPEGGDSGYLGDVEIMVGRRSKISTKFKNY